MKQFMDTAAFKKNRELILMVMDLFIVLFSYLAAIFLKLDFDFTRYLAYGYRYFLKYLGFVLIVNLISFWAFRVHKSLWSYIGVREIITIALSIAASSLLLVAFIVLTSTDLFWVSITIIAGLLCLLIMLNVRVTYRLIRKYSADKNTPHKNALIVGAGDGGYILLKEIEHNAKYDARVIGFVDDQRFKKVISGKNILGDTYELPKIIDKYNIDVVFIAIPSAPKADLRRIVNLCQSSNVEIKIMQKSDNLIIDNDKQPFYPIQSVSITDLLGRGELSLNADEIKSYLMEKTVMVTGAGGSIGSELCHQIAKFKPKKLILLDIYENNLYYLEQEFLRDILHGKMSRDVQIKTYIASIRDKVSIDLIIKEEKPDVVYHAAAHKHVPLMETSPLEAIKNNVFGTKNVIDTCIENKVPYFILISTDKAVNPTSVMGATKRMAELILQSEASNGFTKLAAVRFGNVLGSNGSVIPIFEKQIAEGGPLTITHRDIVRYFMTIPEAAQLVLQAGYYAQSGEIFVLDMGEPVKILDLAEKMIRLSGYVPYDDIDIIEIGLRPGEKMYEELVLYEEKVYNTKNKSISVSEPIPIAKEIIRQKLSVLQQLIDENAPIDTVKETLLAIIKRCNTKTETDS